MTAVETDSAERPEDESAAAGDEAGAAGDEAGAAGDPAAAEARRPAGHRSGYAALIGKPNHGHFLDSAV